MILKLLGKKIEYWYFSFSDVERHRLYSNISRMIKNNKQISSSFEMLAEASKLANDRKRVYTYQKIALANRDLRADAPISNSLKKFIPEVEAEMIARAERGASFEETLKYVSEISDINSRMSKAITKLYRVIIMWVPIYLLIIIGLRKLFKFVFIQDYDSKIRQPIIREINDVSVFTYNHWHYIVGLMVSYALIFFLFRNIRPNKLRETLDKFILFKQYRSLNGSVALISVALELKMSNGENEARIVKRVANNSGVWAKTYLMQMYSGLQSGRISLEEGMAKSHLFTDELRSQVAQIQAVESDDSGLISAAIEAGERSAIKTEKAISIVDKSLSGGIAIIMVLMMIPTAL